MNSPRLGNVRVLLVEDSEADVGLFRQGLKAISAPLDLDVVTDGIQAVRFLKANPPPHLIVLDLNIPGKSGFEVLEELKQDTKLREVPVVVFSSSGAS